MQFNSFVFILVFLPLTIAAYFLLNNVNINCGKYVLITSGIAFYLFSGWQSTMILLASIFLNWLLIQQIRKKNRYSRINLVVAVVGNIMLLFIYKYLGFAVDIINNAFKTEISVINLRVPTGISFFTFQQIMFLIPVYDGRLESTSLLDYLAYILYFPKIVMGPLASPIELTKQFNDTGKKKFNWSNFSCGIKTFSFGLFKKMLLADTFAAAVNWGFDSIGSATSMDMFLIMLSYTFEIYFDFSGYCDMATGISSMLNITLPINFDSPYKALSIQDFWKRWHISLTSFFTKYVYIPLGGNRKGKCRTYLNILIVFIVSGIWHGANLTFILWGLLHGLLSIADRLFDKSRKTIMEPVRWITTFLVVSILWLLFRSNSVAQWQTILSKIVQLKDTSVSSELLEVFVIPEYAFMIKLLHLQKTNYEIRGFAMLVHILVAFIICLFPENNYRMREKNSIFTMCVAAVFFVWGLLCLGSESSFIYFGF